MVVLKLNDSYWRMTRISERYVNLRAIFDKFCHLATSRLTSEKCPIKGIIFLPKLERNYFDVSFVGKKVRFSFFVVEEEARSLRGLVKCNPVGNDEKTLEPVIGEFSFNGQAETEFSTEDGDPMIIDVEWAAAGLVLHFLGDALHRK